MQNLFEPYELIFTEEERKQLIAQSLAEFRKAKKLSQKEVASVLGISQATYSTYERGRTEPPIELLVRLSYFYNVTMDMMVQRDRLIRNTGDAQKKLDELRQQLVELDSQCAEFPEGQAAIEAMQKLLTLADNLNATAMSKQI